MNLHVEKNSPGVVLEGLIARHGGWRILYAVAAAMLKRNRKPARGQVDDLSDWLRRDVGLPPEPVGRNYWNL